MPVAKIHISTELNEDQCRALAEDARHSVVDSLGLAPEFGKVIINQTPLYCRSVDESRDPNFVLAEVLMFKGRTQEIKNRLYKNLTKVISRHTGVDGANVFIDIIESDRRDWGIRGGVAANEVELGY